jgi:hypothetical protein
MPITILALAGKTEFLHVVDLEYLVIGFEEERDSHRQ